MEHYENKLSRRERQIMDILHEHGQLTAQQVLERLPNPPGYSGVRAMLSKLESKQVISHQQQGKTYLYQVVVAPEQAQQTALQRIVKTFFGGSSSKAITALLGDATDQLSEQELAELSDKIAKARQQKKQ